MQFANKMRVTVGFRPAVASNVVLELGENVGIVNGFGGQGWVTGPALAKRVLSEVLAY
jgi:glycine/D-amino acid oxidase-like deaminating enzyme